MYQYLNIDGAKALVADIEWLRSVGLNIRGTAPHNNPAEYGASNSAIFEKSNIWNFLQSGAKGVCNNGKWEPLAVLNEKDLGLDYEADDIYSPEHGMALDYLSPASKGKWWRFFRTCKHLDFLKKNRVREYNWVDELPDIYSSEKDFWYTDSSIADTIVNARQKSLFYLSILNILVIESMKIRLP